MRSEVAILRCCTYDEESINKTLRGLLKLIGGLEKVVKRGDKVLIKPNISFSQTPDRGITTHPLIVKAMINLIKELEGIPVVGDSSVGAIRNMGRNGIWETTGMNEILKETGCDAICFDRSSFKEIIMRGSRKYCITNAVLDSDVVINIPKFKTHSLMTFTGAIKNIFGVVPGGLKRKIHYESPEILEFAEKLVDIFGFVKPNLTIIDGVSGIEGEGPGARGKKRHMGIIMGGYDSVAVDAVAAKLMNIESYDVPTTMIAAKRGLGVGNVDDISVLGESLENVIMNDFTLPITSVYYKNPGLVKKIFGSTKIFIKVDENLCNNCMLCIRSCPKDAIYNNGTFPSIDYENCIECLCCLEVCPQGALKIRKSNLLEKIKSIPKSRTL